MPLQPRLNRESLQASFADVTNVGTRLLSDGVARRILSLLNAPNEVDPPPIPENVVAEGGTGIITVTWDASLGASFYRIYRAPNIAGQFVPRASSADTEFTDVGLGAGETWYYRVSAVDSSGNESDLSGVVFATVTGVSTPAAPPTPTGLVMEDEFDSALSFTWDNLSGTAVATNVYRSTVSGSGYVLIASGVGGGQYLDSDLLNGTTYYYVLKWANSAGALSAYSSEISGTPASADVTAPPIPTGLTAVAGDGIVTLDWEPVVAADLAGYIVGYGEDEGGPYTSLPRTTRTEGIVPGLTNTTEYFFVVASIDGHGNQSDWSDEVSATPAAVGGGDVTPPPVPTGLTAHSPVSGQINLSWNASVASDLAGYRIFVSAPPTGSISGPWVELTTRTAGVTSYVYTPTFNPNATWYFYVTAYDTTGNQSAPSNLVSSKATGSQPGGVGGGPVGGGEVGGGILGAAHKVDAAYSFDYVVDMSAYSGSFNAMSAGANEVRRQVQTGDIILGSTPKNIAILLPARTDDTVCRIQNQDFWFGDIGKLPDGKYNIHFVAPYPDSMSADVEDVLTDIADDTITHSDFLYTLTNDAGGGVLSGGGANLSINTDHNFEGDYHFWFIRIKQTHMLAIDKNESGHTEASVQNAADWHLHGVRVDQQGYTYPLAPDGRRNYGRIAISSYYSRLHVEGLYLDCPWNDEHGIYHRQAPYGDLTMRKMRILRVGGQALQFTNRSTDGPRLGQPLGGTPGTFTLRDIYAVGYGRFVTRAAWGISQYGIHQFVDMADCKFADLSPDDLWGYGSNPNQPWPPPNPLSYSSGGLAGPGALVQSATNTNDPMMANGFNSQGIKMRNCIFYAAVPDKEMYACDGCMSVDVEDSGFFTGPSGAFNSIRIGRQRRSQTSENLINSFHWENNCTSAMITALESEFTLTGTRVPVMLIGQVWPTDLSQNVGDADETFDFTNWGGGAPPPGL